MYVLDIKLFLPKVQCDCVENVCVLYVASETFVIYGAGEC